jgi:hypothetical protein
MTDRIPHLSNVGDSKYTILRDYDHIIASLEVAIENIIRSKTLISEKNSVSFSHLTTMKISHDENVIKLMSIRDQYLEDREILYKESNNVLTS